MPSNIIYQQGSKISIAVPAGEKIAVYTRDIAILSQIVGYPNEPDRKSVLYTLNNEQYVTAAFTTAATVEIEAKAAPVLYQVGADPVITELKGQRLQGAPGVLNATGTLTAAMILAGIVTSTTAAAVAATLDTGTVLDTAVDLDIGDSFDWSAVNTGGANAFTVTASSGHTIVGAGAVAASTSGLFRTRKTAANTYVTYRIG